MVNLILGLLISVWCTSLSLQAGLAIGTRQSCGHPSFLGAVALSRSVGRRALSAIVDGWV